MAEEAAGQLRAEVDKKVRQAVASALAKEGVAMGAGMPTTTGVDPSFSFADQPQAENWFIGRWFIAKGGQGPRPHVQGGAPQGSSCLR